MDLSCDCICDGVPCTNEALGEDGVCASCHAIGELVGLGWTDEELAYEIDARLVLDQGRSLGNRWHHRGAAFDGTGTSIENYNPEDLMIASGPRRQLRDDDVDYEDVPE